MSATNRGAVRADLDFYATPSWCTRAILPHLPVAPRRVVDAGCGTGAIAVEVVAHWPDADLLGVELDPVRAEVYGRRVLVGNFLSSGFTADLVVMNPPFNLAMEFVQHALEVAPVVAALLRLPWLASQKRAAWLRAHPPSVNVLPKRPSFTGDGKTDATDYFWALWNGKPPTVRILDVEAGR